MKYVVRLPLEVEAMQLRADSPEDEVKAFIGSERFRGFVHDENGIKEVIVWITSGFVIGVRPSMFLVKDGRGVTVYEWAEFDRLYKEKL
jgi:hypothetical protein